MLTFGKQCRRLLEAIVPCQTCDASQPSASDYRPEQPLGCAQTYLWCRVACSKQAMCAATIASGSALPGTPATASKASRSAASGL